MAVLEKDGWLIYRLAERVDSFNQNEFRSQIEPVLESEKRKIALDLRLTNFLSLPAIGMIVQWAERLKEMGGEMLLIGPSEKLRRQIVIFGSMDQMQVAKSMDLAVEKPSSRPSEAPSAGESPAPDGIPDF